MTILSSRRCLRSGSRLGLFAAALFGVVICPAQEPTPDSPQPAAPRPTPAQAMQRVERWLAAETRDDQALDAAVDALCEAGQAGMKAFAARVRSAPADDDRLRAGLDLALTRIGIRFFEREGQRGVIYAGQFAPLLPLQPWIGQLYVRLLLEPPDWFPGTDRARLVPALRDLFADPPPAEDVGRIEALADDEAREPQILRMQLAFALAQWGSNRRAQALITDLAQQCADPDPDARLYPLRFLADVHYQMRSYAKAAETYATYFELAAERDHPLQPIEWYNAACCAALAGESQRGLRWLRTAAQRHADEGTDPSQRLQRVLFDEDPEIGALRRTAEFADIVAIAFPRDAEGDRGGKGR